MPCAEELMLCDSVYVKFNSQAEDITGDSQAEDITESE